MCGVVSVLLMLGQTQKLQDKDQPEVTIQVAARGFNILYRSKDADPANNVHIPLTVMRHSAAQVFMEVPLKSISYTGGDDKDDKVLGFIASDQQTNQLVCYLFKSLSKSTVHAFVLTRPLTQGSRMQSLT